MGAALPGLIELEQPLPPSTGHLARQCTAVGAHANQCAPHPRPLNVRPPYCGVHTPAVTRHPRWLNMSLPGSEGSKRAEAPTSIREAGLCGPAPAPPPLALLAACAARSSTACMISCSSAAGGGGMEEPNVLQALLGSCSGMEHSRMRLPWPLKRSLFICTHVHQPLPVAPRPGSAALTPGRDASQHKQDDCAAVRRLGPRLQWQAGGQAQS